MKRNYLQKLIDCKPLIKYLEEKYFGRFRSFNLVFTVVHDSKSERDLFIEDLCTIEELKIFNWYKVGELTDVVFNKSIE
jgi:hypothetical protein